MRTQTLRGRLAPRYVEEITLVWDLEREETKSSSCGIAARARDNLEGILTKELHQDTINPRAGNAHWQPHVTNSSHGSSNLADILAINTEGGLSSSSGAMFRTPSPQRPSGCKRIQRRFAGEYLPTTGTLTHGWQEESDACRLDLSEFMGWWDKPVNYDERSRGGSCVRGVWCCVAATALTLMVDVGKRRLIYNLFFANTHDLENRSLILRMGPKGVAEGAEK
ncbi:hypothetical protein B0H13DRAFT_1853859 [Mycena leptocephala]|nr:hypothetical protein B0H13DRAFT_1853859 [Mycena leptocephala]